MSLRPAYEDVLQALARQRADFRAVEENAGQLVRAAGLMLTFLVGSLAFLASRIPSTSPAAIALLAMSVIMTAASVAIASRLFLRAKVVSLLNPSSYRTLMDKPFDAEDFYRRSVLAYAEALKENAQHLALAGNALRLSRALLLAGLLSSALGSMPLLLQLGG